MLALIIARATNGTIGKDQALPWHIPADLKYFKATTLGNPIIMGRKSWEAIGKPLPKRLNIVVSRSDRPDDLPEQVRWVNSIADAILLGNDAIADQVDGQVFVIGGADLMEQTLHMADILYLTVINADIEGDTYVELDLSNWTCTSRTPPATEGELEYWFEVWHQAQA